MRVKKWLKRLAVTTLVLLVLIVTAGWVITTWFEDDLKAYALEQLDAQLTTDMKVSALDFTLWDRFPHASLRFNDVYIEETFERKDTLLAAENVYLEFNIWDLLGGTYSLEAVDIRAARVQLERGPAGEENFRFWKTDSTAADPIAFDLEHITVADCRFSYLDLGSEVTVRADVHEGTFEGAFADDQFALTATSESQVHVLSVGEAVYIRDKTLGSDVQIGMNLASDTYTFEDGSLTLGGVPFDASGTVQVAPETTHLDLAFVGHLTDVSEAVNNVPENWRASLSAYQPDGLLSFEGTVKGQADANHQPTVSLEYSIDHGAFVHNASAVALSDLSANGTFTHAQGEAAQLVVRQLSAQFEDGRIDAKGSMTGLVNPAFNVHLQGDLDLNDVRKFAQLDDFEVLEGALAITADYEGTIRTDGPLKRSDLAGLKATGKAQFTDAAMQVAGSPLLFEGLKGAFRLENLDVSIEALEGGLEASDFALKGRFNNLIPYALFDQEVLDIQASMVSGTLDFDELLTAESGAASEAYHLSFPKHLSFAMNVEVGTLNFREFKATGLRGKALMKDQQLRIEEMAFATSDGRFNTTATLDGRSADQFALYSTSNIADMDIRKLFESFENFGQSFIQAHHLQGTATATADFRATLGSDLSFDPKNIRSTVDVELRNGELIGLKSMEHIADYIDDNLLISQFVNEDALRGKLEHIQFATLRNTVYIHDGLIEIPSMDIVSSAMDITCSGSHAFDNRIDYSLGFQVRDVLCKSGETEFGRVEDDGLSHRFYLSMKGTSDDPEFGYDRLAHKAQRKADRQAEKEVFKDVVRSGLTGQPTSTVQEPTTPSITISVEDEPKTPDPDKPLSWRDRLKGKGSKDTAPPPSDDDDDDDDDY